MSLKAQIEAGVMQAFLALGDLVRNLTYVEVSPGGQPVIDVETGEFTAPENRYPIPMAVMVRYKAEEIDNDIVTVRDQKCIFPLRYLPAGWIEPGEADYVIVEKTGRRWEIKQYTGEPSEVVFIGRIRD